MSDPSAFCDSCGQLVGPTAYRVKFYILPSRLRRKRHKDKAREALYCATCYDNWQRVPYFVDGIECPLSKVQKAEPREMLCPICIKPLPEILPGLYGLIVSECSIDDSSIETWPLATFCGECVENHEIEFLRLSLDRDKLESD